MEMKRSALAAELKASLHDAGGLFDAVDDADFARFIDLAAADLGRVRPLLRRASFDLQADADASGCYPTPADFRDFHSTSWGTGHGIAPWSANYPGEMPRVRCLRTAAGQVLELSIAPSPRQLALLGSRYAYRYYASHAVLEDPTQTTVRPQDRGLLLLRAQAEACKELAIRNVVKPMALRDGMSQGPRNGTPAALFAELMRLFEEARQ
ncbi:hypothetical protein [Chitinimonas sp.]|uniref:hypothetical protein n=1 Tax=Chitinimonas sp. TaxID=1934313 RepID=UPI0035B094F4